MQKIKAEAGFVLSSREAKHFEITTIFIHPHSCTLEGKPFV